MSADNGVIRVGRKGKKKFAFGEDGDPFEVDVVATFQRWIEIDESFREATEDQSIPTGEMSAYHQAAVNFVSKLAGMEPTEITIAEALDFIARLSEQYNELTAFFRPKSRDVPASPDTSGAELRFSAEPES